MTQVIFAAGRGGVGQTAGSADRHCVLVDVALAYLGPNGVFTSVETALRRLHNKVEQWGRV